ncbi:hypothetical protein ACFFMM_22500 [Micromonospora chaiyaphumensis]|uniref:Uncharacterized protein n=1 Tax=Micromonospora chaiyaphumensis TaxID=307119 RepID=A0A1C4U6Y9_9ACTN|nr:hypothetical protein [Micromonospora chaiyaphumensis]SCE67379.1 hypothetical protein GA0070214_101401 [Micromonospora chaiyaphumensis]
MRGRRLLAAAVAVVLALTGCGSPRAGGGAAGAEREADLRYGAAPAPGPDVTLQPDVVVVGGGGRSVRSVSADGLTWRLDAAARNADRLAPGKVMFVTGRGVGRVLDLAESGGDLLVTIGPVDITEVVRDGTFASRGLTLDDPVVHPAGEPSWAEEPPAPRGTFGRSRPVLAPAAPPTQPAPQRGGRGAAKAQGYQLYTSCCTDGVGAHFAYDDGGVRLVGTVTLTFTRPDASFHLEIGAGTVTRAELEIGGGFGIKVDFEGGISDGRNHKKVFPIPVDISFPIGHAAGIPLSFTVTQTLEVTTAFGARSGTVKGSGEYALAGKLGFGWADGRVGPRVTTSFQRRSSLLDSLTGVPVGVMGLLIRHGVRFTVGISAFLFTAGVYFELTTSYGATLGSALGAPYALCRGVGIGVRATFGVGYRILEPVVQVINKFLSLLTPSRAPAIPPIAATAGPSWHRDVYRNEEVVPSVPICGHAPR